METETSPLGTIKREKLRTLQKNFTITTKTMPSLKKYAPKCARNIKIVRDDCPKTTSPHLKWVNGFSFIFHGYSQNRHRLQKNQIFKIIKHHKKFIQSCKGIQLTPQYTKELLQLRSFQFNYSYREPEEEYRAITFCHSLKSFSLDLKYGYSRTEIELITQIEKNKHKIQRALRNMKSIRKLSLKFKSQCVTSLFIFLQLFGSCPLFLSRLKFFDFDLFSCDETYYPDEDFTHDVNVRMALRFITHLAIFNHTLFEMIIFDPELMGNLTNLTMRISAHKDCSEETIKKLSMLKLLPKLKELDLGFTSGSKLKEKIFLESFSLPKHIETVILRLTNFVWKDLSLKLTKENRRIIEEKFEEHPRFQRFYNEWASLNHLHTLKLTINNRNDERKCPSLTLKFATGILKNLKDLKNLRYENDDTISLDENLSHKIIPIDLGVFWGMLKNSKKTLENLEIITDINFFGKKDLQQEDFVGGFKRLKNVEMSGQVYWARNFGDFLSMIIVKEKIISVNVNSLCFKEEKYLNDFFENLARIPKNSDTTLEIDVSRLACSKWIENFCRFIDSLKVEGKLKLKMKGADGGVLKQENRIRASVEKNPVFEELLVQYRSLMGRNKDLKF